MGQAKLRGTKEERVTQALTRKRLAEEERHRIRHEKMIADFNARQKEPQKAERPKVVHTRSPLLRSTSLMAALIGLSGMAAASPIKEPDWEKEVFGGKKRRNK